MRKFPLIAFLCTLAAAPAAAQQQPSPPAKSECQPSKGVICPPDVDPAMKIPPPETGSKMPVIPPPGTPGGDQKSQPK